MKLILLEIVKKLHILQQVYKILEEKYIDFNCAFIKKK